jgi:acetylornithine deacetylase/succinyl-diaminopimelate desuccinylase-like protein
MRHKLSVLAATLALSGAASAQTPPALVEDSIGMLGDSIAFASVEKSPDILKYAEYLKARLVKGGFAAGDIEIDASGPAPTLVAYYRGASAEKAIILSGHMDVVEAKAEDWGRNPFAMTREGDYLIGRGAVDNKWGVVMMVETLIRLKQEGFSPSRDIILALSGDEETQMASTAILAERFRNAGLVLNSDGGGGTLGEDGAPLAYNLQTAEKTYTDYEIAFTNPGGHSSRPSRENAIYRLARAIDRIAAYDFPVATSETTLEFFRQTGAKTPGALGQAMLRFAENPKDRKAVRTLRADPEYVGQTGTTCVATMLGGGHALNALPQRASVSVNCRIFPGVTPEAVMETLKNVVDDPAAEIRYIDPPHYSDGSPMRADVLAAVKKSIEARYPGLAITPQMSAGASDSLYFRMHGVDSYGVSGLFLKPSDDFSHGLNERAPVSSIAGALDHWHTILTDLAK